jgi:putative ABC transport system substrate-binding protein
VTRRELIALLGSTAALLWPQGVGAQQAAIPVVGFLHSGSPETLQHLLSGFHQGLAETGFVEGQNVKIEYRWARGQYNQVPALAAELVDHRVSVIVAGGGEVTALAVKAATQTIPVVFTTANDPVKLGLVQSLGHPGGNLTGLLSFTSVVETKKLGLLQSWGSLNGENFDWNSPNRGVSCRKLARQRGIVIKPITPRLDGFKFDPETKRIMGIAFEIRGAISASAK